MTSQDPTLNLDEVFLENVEMSVDSKGRVGIPEKFMKVIRKICPEHAGVIGLTPTPERSIKLMPYPLFAQKVGEWGRLNGEKQAERTMLNVLTSYSGVFPLDPQNRIKLHPGLIKLCNIKHDVVITGNIHFMQIFDSQRFEEMMGSGLNGFDDCQEKASAKQTATAPIQLVLNPTVALPAEQR